MAAVAGVSTYPIAMSKPVSIVESTRAVLGSQYKLVMKIFLKIAWEKTLHMMKIYHMVGGEV